MKALLMDTETNGLLAPSIVPLAKQPRITEFYGCLVEDDGTVLEELEFLCSIGEPLSEEITRITGITDADLADKPPFSAHCDEIAALLEKADAVVAHNLHFDSEMLRLEFLRADPERKIMWPIRRICTIQETEHYKGFRLNLTGLHEHLFGEGFPAAHRAGNDVMALKRCWVELRKRGDV